MIRSLRYVVATIVALSALGFGAAQAAVVTWGSPFGITGDSEVSTNGSLVAAYNLGSASDTTVNGVVFKGLAIGSPQVVSITFDTLYTLAIINENSGHTLQNFDTSSASAPFSGLSSAYRSLLGSSAGHVFGDYTTTLTIAGLTAGQTYEFQAWVNDSGVSGCCSFGIGLDGVSLNPNTATVFDDIIGEDVVVAGGLGQFVIGTFVADGTQQQAMDFLRGEIGGGINGFQLRTITAQNVPEPGTGVLVGLAALGLVVARRRSKRS